MSTIVRLAKSSLFRSAALIMQTLIALVIMPYLLKHLGPRLYGFWALVGDTLAYYALFDLGLSTAVSRYVARALGRDDDGEMSRVAGTALAIFCAVGGLVIGVTIGIAALSHRFVPDPDEQLAYAQVVLILGASFALGLPVRVHSGVLQALLRYDLVSIAAMARALVMAGLVVALVRSRGSVVMLAAFTAASQGLEYLLLIYFQRTAVRSVRVSVRYASKTLVRSLMSFSATSFVAQAADVLRYRLDTLVIAACVGLEAITSYVIGARLLEYLSQFLLNAFGLLMPVFSRLEGQGDSAGIRRHLGSAVRLAAVSSVFGGGYLLIFGAPFIGAWMGPGFEQSYLVIAIMVVPLALALAQAPCVGALYGTSKHQGYAVMTVAEGVANLGLSILLARRLGVIGVALGTALPMLITKAIVQPIMVCRALGLSLGTYYLRLLGKPAVLTALPLVAFAITLQEKIRPNYVSVAIWMVSLTLLYLPYGWRVLLAGEERIAARAALSRLVGARRD